MASLNAQYAWYRVNFTRIREKFWDATFDCRNGTWFKLPHFRLPQNWLQSETALLVMLPGINGDFETQIPDEFYVNKGLRTKRHRTPRHLFNDSRGGYNRFAHLGWARLSCHVKEWNPTLDGVTGDNLVSLLGMIQVGLLDLAYQTDKAGR